MSNKIQIKRSIANSTVTGLSNGELAFTANGNVLYIGDPNDGSSIRIGGQMVPGTLTANQALVANSTSGIDNVIVANLAANSIYANGSSGVSQLLASNSTGGAYWIDQGAISINVNATYTWTNVHTFNANLNGNTVNAVSFTSGSDFTANSTLVNAIAIAIGSNFTANSTVVNAASINVVNQVNTATFFANTSANVGANVYANTSAVQVGNDSVNTVITAGSISLSGATINATNYTGTANNASYLGGNAAANFVQNTDSRTMSGNLYFSGANIGFGGANLNITGTNTYITANININGLQFTSAANTSLTGANLSIAGTNTAISSNLYVSGANSYFSGNVTIGGANIVATSAHLAVADATISGNLTINGTLTTVNTNNLVVRDNMIQVASNNISSDSLDSGFYVTSNTDGITRFSGLARFYGDSTASNPVFRLFTTATEPTTTVSSSTLGTLKAYLDSAGLISNATSVAITANSSLNVAITANSLSLTTALVATSGGTGQNTYSNGDLLVGNTGDTLTKLSLSSTVGHVLQSNGTALVYDILDGGTF